VQACENFQFSGCITALPHACDAVSRVCSLDQILERYEWNKSGLRLLNKFAATFDFAHMQMIWLSPTHTAFYCVDVTTTCDLLCAVAICASSYICSASSLIGTWRCTFAGVVYVRIVHAANLDATVIPGHDEVCKFLCVHLQCQGKCSTQCRPGKITSNTSDHLKLGGVHFYVNFLFTGLCVT
jgi:hypothetical protein